MSITEDLKDEIALLINERVEASSMSYRNLSSNIEGLTPALISQIRNYKLSGISIERLIQVISKLDAYLYSVSSEFTLELDTENKVISVCYSRI